MKLSSLPLLFGCLAVAPSGVLAQPTVADSNPPAAGAPTVIYVQPSSGTSTGSSPASTAAAASTDNPADGADLNANLPSSSRPTTDTTNSSDGFDLRSGSTGSVVVRGRKGSMAITGESVKAVDVPALHTVRRGDTLWDLCDHYFDNPWQWPRVWSYNPEIRNPNWIYPGDQLRMRSSTSTGLALVARSLDLGRGPEGGSGRGLHPSLVGPDTVFLRTEGYIDDPDKDNWGEVVGAVEEQMMLGEGNRIYLDLKREVAVRPGQELTIFEPVRNLPDVEGARKPPGEMVAIRGTARVTSFDPDKHIARAEIVESMDVVERGMRVGAVGRRYVVVPPKPNTKTQWARVLSSFYPNVYFGQNQVVFVDRGREDGLVPGNRLLVVRKGDTWRRSLETTTSSARDRLRLDVEEHSEVQPTVLKREERDFPEEIIAELRVVHADRYSSLVLVTSSAREVVSGDRAIARQGF